MNRMAHHQRPVECSWVCFLALLTFARLDSTKLNNPQKYKRNDTKTTFLVMAESQRKNYKTVALQSET